MDRERYAGSSETFGSRMMNEASRYVFEIGERYIVRSNCSIAAITMYYSMYYRNPKKSHRLGGALFHILLYYVSYNYCEWCIIQDRTQTQNPKKKKRRGCASSGSTSHYNAMLASLERFVFESYINITFLDSRKQGLKIRNIRNYAAEGHCFHLARWLSIFCKLGSGPRTCGCCRPAKRVIRLGSVTTGVLGGCGCGCGCDCG